MTPERARKLLTENGYAAREICGESPDGRVHFFSETMTIAEYDEVMAAWNHRKYGSFNDVLRDIANHLPVWTTDLMTIVITWVTFEREWDGKPHRADLGEGPWMRNVVKPHACIWLNEGTPEDVDRALVYLGRERPESGLVFVFSPSEQDPLGKARECAIRARQPLWKE